MVSIISIKNLTPINLNSDSMVKLVVGVICFGARIKELHSE